MENRPRDPSDVDFLSTMHFALALRQDLHLAPPDLRSRQIYASTAPWRLATGEVH
jgi:hypothetical protein